MTKEKRLEFIRRRFKALKKADEIVDDVVPLTTPSSGDITDTMKGMNTFQEGRRDRKRERGVINSDD